MYTYIVLYMLDLKFMEGTSADSVVLKEIKTQFGALVMQIQHMEQVRTSIKKILQFIMFISYFMIWYTVIMSIVIVTGL